MTNVIKVKSLDTLAKKLPELEIETGFYSALLKFLRFGDYLFTTLGYCEMTSSFATQPSRTTSSIFTYPPDILQDSSQEYIAQLFSLTESREVEKIKDADKKGKKLEQLVAEARLWETTADENERLAKSRKLLFVTSYHDIESLSPINRSIMKSCGTDQIISVGKYILELETFSYFTAYVLNGGFMGWPNNYVPPFAVNTKEAIRASQHPMYAQLKTFLQPKPEEMN